MTLQRSVAGLLLLLGVALVLAGNPPATAGPAPPSDGGLPPALPGVAGTPLGSATPTATPTPTATGTAGISPTPTCGPAWRVVPAPDVGPLRGVALISATDAWAVGQDGILRWDGTIWNAVPYPTPPGALDAEFNDVAAMGPNDAWAVGWYEDPVSGGLTFTIHWDGTAWTQVASPNGGRWSQLADVVMISPTDVWAVGKWVCTWPLCNAHLLIHWDGQTWQDLSHLVGGYSLSGIGATAADNVWVVGSAYSHDEPIWHWDGAQWNGYRPGFVFQAVSATGRNDVWAVGSDSNTASLAVHWDGAGWTTAGVPNVGALTGVHMLTPSYGWAVGASGNILHWDGVAWTLAAGPGTPLNDVAVWGPQDAWAVGADAQNHSLILRYTTQFFADVPATQPFYPYIQWLACRTYISGYADGTFRPGVSVTRAQMLKIVVNTAGWPVVTPATPTFADVPDTHPFYAFIETGVSQGIINGYTCGGPNEPCDPANRPYFRPGTDITRGQLSKVIALARGYVLPSPPMPTFVDLPAAHPFYSFVEALAAHNIVAGYGCGGPGEPCDPANRPYFRPAANATRGQVSKFITIAYGGP